jgi:short-subunit dehydrogenase
MSVNSYVFITGAAGGLGKAFASECASRGWNLFLTDLSETALRSLAEGLKNAYGTDVIWRTADLTDCSSRNELYDFVRINNYRFWCLINVAGLDFEGAFTDRQPNQIRTLLRLNIEANLETTYALLPLRDQATAFRIINVASLAAYYPMPLKAMYSSSKRFILQFSLALREELRSAGVTVTTLCPAGMPTTAECIRSIETQGLAGKVTTKNVGFVASGTIDHALKGRAVYIPGAVNRVLKFCGGIVPPTVIARLVGSRWKSSRGKLLPT